MFKLSIRYFKFRRTYCYGAWCKSTKTQNDLTYFVGGASISVVGGISFLGLIAPHIARSIVGLRYFHVVIMSGCIGSILILFSDGLARGIHPPLDIPVGVIIAIIGVPYFLFLLRRI